MSASRGRAGAKRPSRALGEQNKEPQNTDGPRRDSSPVLMFVAVERRERQAANVKSDWSDCHQNIYIFFSSQALQRGQKEKGQGTAVTAAESESSAL